MDPYSTHMLRVLNQLLDPLPVRDHNSPQEGWTTRVHQLSEEYGVMRMY